jgi:hypothetical protein
VILLTIRGEWLGNVAFPRRLSNFLSKFKKFSDFNAPAMSEESETESQKYAGCGRRMQNVLSKGAVKKEKSAHTVSIKFQTSIIRERSETTLQLVHNENPSGKSDEENIQENDSVSGSCWGLRAVADFH